MEVVFGEKKSDVMNKMAQKKKNNDEGKWDPKELLRLTYLPFEELAIFHAYQCKNPKPNILLLKEMVGDCIHMTVQKTSGLQKNLAKTQMSWDNWERVRMTIIAEAIVLVRSGVLDSIEDMRMSNNPVTESELPDGWDFYFNGKDMTGFRGYAAVDSIHSNLKPRGTEANIPALKELVQRLGTSPVHFAMSDLKRACENHDRYFIKTGILCETVALVLSGVLGNIEITQKE